ncbi:hypothetical protein PQS31_05400 [Luteimonas sp BLCC-B24]|uniref:hypothetical protein n=1 Tax=Luteimonas sp. BLCC-B24 TaxID=3025317 RepID=UPI00234CFE12|nr:hypothetical protein [Luteimonas sp. BLCC-B24]MDC7806257.1 hypothetical protein [Luteimonas sp. BLCC-B24]
MSAPACIRALPLLAGLLLAACGDAAPPPPAPVAPSPQRAPAPPVADTETVIAHYDCPTAGEIDIIRDGRFARLRMVDGRTVHLGAIQGSRPPVWSEVGLRFVADGDFIELSQDSGRTIACTASADMAERDTPED